MKASRTVHKHESTEVRQKQIVNAARKLIIRYGSEHVTVRRIAREVGFSEGAIYRHFKSKKDILALLADHIEDSLLEDITHSGTADRTPLETLDFILKSHLSAVEQRRGISFQVIAEIVSLGDRNLNRKISGTIDKYIGHLKGLLQEAVRAGQIRNDVDLDAAAMVLFGMIQGLVNIWALSNYRFNPLERYTPLWDVFCEAVVKP
ncbi:MAG: TetR/AcrR family transcriptional regulator [Chloroflexota bacterium]